MSDHKAEVTDSFSSHCLLCLKPVAYEKDFLNHTTPDGIRHHHMTVYVYHSEDKEEQLIIRHAKKHQYLRRYEA